MIKVSKLKPNPQNPRVIRDAKFAKLKQSIQDFPEMMSLRPIIVSNGFVIGGNMRLKAIIDLGIKEVPEEWVKYEDLSEEKQKEFIIKDNVGFGEWEWDTLANEWDEVQLGEWGVEVWTAPITDINSEEIEAKQLEYDARGTTEHECPKCKYKW